MNSKIPENSRELRFLVLESRKLTYVGNLEELRSIKEYSSVHLFKHSCIETYL
jgi:hypothetical protein